MEKSKKRRGTDGSEVSSSWEEETIGQGRRQLDTAKDFMVHYLQEAEGEAQEIRQRRWEKIPDNWKGDKDIAFTALDTDCCNTISCLPFELQNDQEFLLDCIEKGAYIWHSLSNSLKDDLDFVRRIRIERLNGDHADDLRDIFERHPSLRTEREFWMKVVGSLEYNLFYLANAYWRFTQTCQNENKTKNFWMVQCLRTQAVLSIKLYTCRDKVILSQISLRQGQKLPPTSTMA